MLISNSVSKNKIEGLLTTSSSNSIFMRSDGFRKVIKGFSTVKSKIPEEAPQNHSKLHTSSGFRRFTKEYKLQPDVEGKGDVSYGRTMTAAKEGGRRGGHMFSSQGATCANNDKKTVEFLRLEQEEEQCFRNICKILNVAP